MKTKNFFTHLPMSSRNRLARVTTKLIAFLGLAVYSFPTSAAENDTVCRELAMVPIIAHRVPGAYGSIWQTHLAITNHSADPVGVLGHGACQFNPCQPPDPIKAESTIFPRVYTPYLEVDCARAADVSFQLRVQDLSRELETWGVSIPVVREGDLFQGRLISILDIPNTAQFRSMLRVYGFDSGKEGQVTIKIYGLEPAVFEGGRVDELLVEILRTVQVDPLAPTHSPPQFQLPLWLVPELEGHARLRLEVTGGPELRLWAFVSATNNDTQHVTVLTPQ
ncbi:MAG TPA: hypothetical protein VMO47_14750 [Rhodothermales bacterium]|nr:hypothetical protein [Rhodothermales bacterium]